VAIADAWTRLGVSAEPVVVPPQRITDRPYMWTFPGFLTLRQPNSASSLSRIRMAQTPLAENNYVGSNYGRYMNPEFDGLIETYFVTIPRAERMDVLRRIMHHISDQVTMMGLFYDADIMFIANRLKDVTATQSELSNVHLWDVR
jgi:ABC-type transport system substrate-binding protein